jgi:hypothetical protein
MCTIILTCILILVASLRGFSQQKKKFSCVTLYEIAALSPGQCAAPWNMPSFIRY